MGSGIGVHEPLSGRGCAAVTGLGIAFPDSRRGRQLFWLGLGFGLAAVLLRALHWGYTGREWEDALITCLHSKNAGLGLGLTHHHPGEPPVHGFTSPLSVLVPLMTDWFWPGSGVAFIKLASLPAAFLTVLYMAATLALPRFRLPAILAAMALGFLAIEHHQILFAVSGMETQLVQLALSASLYYLLAQQPKRLGAALGACMLARPDMALWAVIAGAALLLWRPRMLIPVAAIALAVYAPWLIFTTLYYGSPVPHTIIAKGLTSPPWRFLVQEPAETLRGAWEMVRERVHRPLAPSFGGHGWGYVLFYVDQFRTSPISMLILGLAAVGACGAVVARQWVWLPITAYAGVYSFYLVAVVPVVMPWYVVPLLPMAVLLAAKGVSVLTGMLPGPHLRTAVQGAFAVLYVGAFAAVLPQTFYADRMIQRVIEDGVRKETALWLARNTQENARIYTEPLGYFSYYSGRWILDFPGLANPSVVAVRRRGCDFLAFPAPAAVLAPEYIVLRPGSVEAFFSHPLMQGTSYRQIAEFVASPHDLSRVPWARMNHDTHFVVFERQVDCAEAPSLDSSGRKTPGDGS